MNKVIAGVLGLGVLAVGGFILANILFITTPSALSNNMDQQPKATCENTLDTTSQLMETGQERTIPKSCFTSDDEPVLSKLSKAQPGDKFTKTEDGIEVSE